MLLLLSLGTLKAQETSLSSGGDASGLGGSASYSIGQIVYTTATGNPGSMAQGVQQPFEISVMQGLDVTDFALTAYPNPTTDNLVLRVENEDFKAFDYRVYDLMGHTVASGPMNGYQTVIDMEALSVSTYFLTVRHFQKTIKTFKIIKR